jgi:hypothetical protein
VILNGMWAVFMGGVLGWVPVELAKFGLGAITGTIEGKYFKMAFCAGAVALAIVSGVVATLNGIEHVELIKAVQYGINAPAIVSGLATAHKSTRSRNPAVRLGVAPDVGQSGAPESKSSFMTRVVLLQPW